MFLVHLLHKFIHFCGSGVGMLPELSGDGEGVHLARDDVLG
jgi:hypothetical protein